jgi:hypothetical protein
VVSSVKKPKFDEEDRKKVIFAVEKHFGVRLLPGGRTPKYRKDETGKPYWVFGGYDDWHGIKGKKLQEEQRHGTEGVLGKL